MDLIGDLGRVDLVTKVDLRGELGRVDRTSKVDLIGELGRVDPTSQVVLVAKWPGQVGGQGRRDQPLEWDWSFRPLPDTKMTILAERCR